MTPYNPFYPGVSIDDYITAKGNMNVVDPKTGQSWIEYLLTFKASNPTHHVELFNLLANKKLKTDKLDIQKHLVEKLQLLYLSHIKTKEQLSIFINRINLDTTVSFNGYENMPVLHYLLCSKNSFYQFNLFKEHHKKFPEYLCLLSAENNNVWHQFIDALLPYGGINSNRLIQLDDVEQMEVIDGVIDILTTDFLEGAIVPNKSQKTPSFILQNITKRKPKGFIDNICTKRDTVSKLQKMETYIKLQAQMPSNIATGRHKI